MNKRLQLLIAILFATVSITAQTIYDVQPGTKENRITLTLSNVSELNRAEGVEVKLVKTSSYLSFNKDSESIELIKANTETDITFTFNINRDAPLNKKDTIEFMITGMNSISLMKSFIFNYIGPKEFKLEQNYPNPFNPTTTIQYQLPQDARVTLKVYDVLGSEVTTLINEEQEAGYKEVQFNGSSIASGMYIYRLTAGSFSIIKKMMLVK
jgi:Secretion system C-terminal sorting domain